MHITIIKLKNGTELVGSIYLFRPTQGWLSLFSYEPKIWFDDIESAVTKGERISKSEVGDQDELERARQDLIDGRKFKWAGYPRNIYPWERCSHCGKAELKVIDDDNDHWSYKHLQCLSCDSTYNLEERPNVK